ncbi:MAG: hypothetical protein Q9207_003384 [Kuettlingeria erythrocarpa]
MGCDVMLDRLASLLDERTLQLDELTSRLQDERVSLGTLVPVGTQEDDVLSAALGVERQLTLGECQSQSNPVEDNVMADLSGRNISEQERWAITINVKRRANGFTLSAELLGRLTIWEKAILSVFFAVMIHCAITPYGLMMAALGMYLVSRK